MLYIYSIYTYVFAITVTNVKTHFLIKENKHDIDITVEKFESLLERVQGISFKSRDLQIVRAVIMKKTTKDLICDNKRYYFNL